jgi:hypothetical protein
MPCFVQGKEIIPAYGLLVETCMRVKCQLQTSACPIWEFTDHEMSISSIQFHSEFLSGNSLQVQLIEQTTEVLFRFQVFLTQIASTAMGWKFLNPNFATQNSNSLNCFK